MKSCHALALGLLSSAALFAASVDPYATPNDQAIGVDDASLSVPAGRGKMSRKPQMTVEVESAGNVRSLGMMRQEAGFSENEEQADIPNTGHDIEDDLMAKALKEEQGSYDRVEEGHNKVSDPDQPADQPADSSSKAPRRRRSLPRRRRSETPKRASSNTSVATGNSTTPSGYTFDRNGKYWPIVLMVIAIVFVGIVVIIVVKVATAWNKTVVSETREEVLNVKLKPSSIDEDLYGLAVCVIVRDCREVICGTDALGLRAARMATSVVTLSFLMSLQVYILVEMDQLVASLAVNNVRSLYDRYELVMYGNDITHTREVAYGGRRGLEEFFNAANFYQLTDDDREGVCQIALSQVTFLMVILLIWTLTCSADIKRATRFALRVLYCTRHINSMRDALEDGEDIQDTHQDADIHTETISGLTTTVKALLFPFMAVRIFVGCYLLWLGCLWLMATANFQEIVFNVVALDFVLVLQSLLYHTLVPARYKREVASTLLVPMDTDGVDTANCFTFFGNYFLIFACFLWVILYVYWLQQILPEYQWDVQGPCAKYLAEQSKAA